MQEVDCNIDDVSKIMENLFGNAHHHSKIKTTHTKNTQAATNTEFSIYQTCLQGSSQDDINIAIERYQIARNEISKEMCSHDHEKWKRVIADKNTQKLWKHTDWKGNMSKQPVEQPLLEDISTYFESLYSSSDHDELLNMNTLESNVYIPLLDDSISGDDVSNARKDTKKGGYDFTLSALDIVLEVLNPIILILLNTMFYVSYPTNLAISMLTAIPKKGNSKFCYRGIQMLPTLGAFFDRILANRLNKWAGVGDEQTAFQKGMSTILQLFTIRILIDIARKTKTTIYIATLI